MTIEINRGKELIFTVCEVSIDRSYRFIKNIFHVRGVCKKSIQK
mgnify:CR=1 FL=1